jgi:hypothetical protein
VAAADERVASAQRADDLRCARDQRYHAFGLVISYGHQRTAFTMSVQHKREFSNHAMAQFYSYFLRHQLAADFDLKIGFAHYATLGFERRKAGPN